MGALTLKSVRAKLAQIDITIGRTQYNEYRVNFKGGKESTAYYTQDLSDAYDTGVYMRRNAT